jgi:hypothetical protein
MVDLSLKGLKKAGGVYIAPLDLASVQTQTTA